MVLTKLIINAMMKKIINQKQGIALLFSMSRKAV